MDWNEQMYADTGNVALLSEIIISKYDRSKSQSLSQSLTWAILEEWGFLHHRVHQTWRSVHDTWPPDGRGKDLHSLCHGRTHVSQQRHVRLRMWARGRESCEGLKSCLFNLFWSNYGWCPLWLQVLCRCSTAFWTGTCLTVCCQLSEGPASLLNKSTEELRLHFRFSLTRDI